MGAGGRETTSTFPPDVGYQIPRDMLLQLELHQLSLSYAGLRIARPQAEAQLMVSMAREGQTTPVLAVPKTPEGDRYVLIDGYLRIGALRHLKRDTVQAAVLSLSERNALLWHRQQESKRRRSALEEAWFLQALIETHGMSQGELARKMCCTTSWVSRRLALITILPEEVQELVRKGRLCAYAAGRHLVPLARANTESCKKLAKNIATHKLSTRAIKRLYVAWKEGDAQTRERIEAQPDLFLKAADEVESTRPRRSRRGGQRCDETTTTGEMSLTDELLSDLDRLAILCNRIHKKLGTEPRAAPLPESIHQAWNRTWQTIQTLARNLENHDRQ